MDSSAAIATPPWNLRRPFLTGQFYQEVKVTPGTTEGKGFSVDSSSGTDKVIGCYHATIQELIVIDDLLSALLGIEGRYISIKKVRGKEDAITFQVDASMDLALQEFSKRLFPLCESYILINQFVETRSQFKTGLVNHAFAAALRALLLDYQAMVAQLEHQFRLGKLSIQGLWFYCQPMMGSMQALSLVVKKAAANNCSGSAVLNLLQSQAKAMAGDHVVRSLLEKMSQSASTAYLRVLERWVYEGVIEDPYGEFFIAENKSLQKESLTQDYDTKYWQQRYSLKDEIPSFLANAAETILITGKYLNVMRECGHSIQIPVAEKSKLTIAGSNHHYLECIKSAYDFASGELLNLVKNKYDLMGKLQSIKHYLLLDQGDFLVHFMDTAREELMKKPDEISVEKLQSLLDLALRSTAAAADPCHEDLLCCVERTTLLKRLSTLKDLEISRSAPDSNDLEEPLSITGLETFSLNYKLARSSTNSTGYLPPPTSNKYKVTLSIKARTDGKKSPNVCLWCKLNLRPHGAQPDFIEPLGRTLGSISAGISDPLFKDLCTFKQVRWPLSLVISRKALTKYQLIFRFLFHCKHVDRQLSGAWQVHQGLRKLDMQGTTVSVSSLLCRNMLKFINSLLHYLTFEASFIPSLGSAVPIFS
ncbi:Gamma-tubulin complex component 2 [Capsicum chinense]|nr:Gamma-tubulin complex component 2 [Capsicum chinense]